MEFKFTCRIYFFIQPGSCAPHGLLVRTPWQRLSITYFSRTFPRTDFPHELPDKDWFPPVCIPLPLHSAVCYNIQHIQTFQARKEAISIMIIWISGAYGVGKSTLAEALKEEIEDSLIFDAEEVGNAVRGNYPDNPYGFIFEDYPLWSQFCYELLKDIHNTFHKNILVPMTLLRHSSYVNIIERLLNDGMDVRLIILEASYQNIHDRILARGETEDCWCMQNIQMASRESNALREGYHINTDGASIEELVQAVLAYIQSSRFS